MPEALKSWYGSQRTYKTFAAAARACGVSESSFRDYIHGRRIPRRIPRQRLLSLMGGLVPKDVGVNAARPLFPSMVVTSSGFEREPLDAGSRLNPPSLATSEAAIENLPEEARRPMNETNDPGSQPKYQAYMATALTHLERTARMGVIFISDCVANVCRTHGIELYEPRKATDPVHNATIQDSRVYLLDREKVTMSDLVIVLCEFPSFGAGQEIEIAGNATVPLILLAMDDKKPSRMVTGVPVHKELVLFSDPDSLAASLDKALTELRPHIEARRAKMSSAPIPRDLGRRIRDLRKRANLDPTELADEIGVSEQFIKNLEAEDVSTTNLSLVQLALLANVLKVPMYMLFGECDADENPIPSPQIAWARRRGISTHRLRAVLDYAARTPPDGSADSLPNEHELDAMLERLKNYESEVGP